MRLTKSFTWLLAACAIAAAVPAAAQTASANMEVSAFVVSNCSFSIAPLVFGNYDPLGTNQLTPLDAATEVRLFCSRDSQATLSLDSGLNPSGPGARRMANGLELLGYQVFRDSARTQPWGEGSDAMVLSAFAGGTEPELIPVYGRIPAAQAVLSGAYNDVVTARVDF